MLLYLNYVKCYYYRDDEQSLDFAQNYLMDKSNQSRDQMHRLEQTYALMAFDNPEQSIFGHLMREDQRQMLAHEVNGKLLTRLNMPGITKLETEMKKMIWNKAHINNNNMDIEISPETAEILSKELFGENNHHSRFTHF